MVVSIDYSDLNKVKKQVEEASNDANSLKVFANRKRDAVPNYITCRNGIGSSLNTIYSKARRLDSDCDDLYRVIIAYKNRVEILIYGPEGKEGFFDWVTKAVGNAADFYVNSMEKSLVIMGTAANEVISFVDEKITSAREWWQENKNVVYQIVSDVAVIASLVIVTALSAGTLGPVLMACVVAGATIKVGMKGAELYHDGQALLEDDLDEKEELMNKTLENDLQDRWGDVAGNAAYNGLNVVSSLLMLPASASNIGGSAGEAIKKVKMISDTIEISTDFVTKGEIDGMDAISVVISAAGLDEGSEFLSSVKSYADYVQPYLGAGLDVVNEAYQHNTGTDLGLKNLADLKIELSDYNINM